VRDLNELPPSHRARLCSPAACSSTWKFPSATLADLGALPARHLVIDRTPISEDPDDRLCVQHVPNPIYEASYPCWILSHSRLLSEVSKTWRVISDYACVGNHAHTDDGLEFEYADSFWKSTHDRSAPVPAARFRQRSIFGSR